MTRSASPRMDGETNDPLAAANPDSVPVTRLVKQVVADSELRRHLLSKGA